MKVARMVDFYRTCLKNKRRVLFVGKSGIGKTVGMTDACLAEGYAAIVLCSAIEDPSTIRGYPSRGENGRASHCLFDGIGLAMEAKIPTCLIFDDLGQATEATAKSIMRFVQFGEIDGRKLPECVVIGAATNDVGHGAGVQGLIEPLKQRFHTIVNVETSVDDVLTYGIANGWHPGTLAFLRNCPEALHDWKPSKDMHHDGACPRGWEYSTQWLNLGERDPEVHAGCVGKGRAAQMLAHLELYNELPDIDAVLLSPDTEPIPENPSAKHLIAMALACRMSAGNFGQCVKYLNRMEAMFEIFSVNAATAAEAQKRKMGKWTKDDRRISSSNDFVAWHLTARAKSALQAEAS